MTNDNEMRETFEAGVKLAHTRRAQQFETCKGSYEASTREICEWFLEGQAALQSRSQPADHHKESVRCMSAVFDDIAALVGLPKEQYGDPDALMDAIEALKSRPPSRRGRCSITQNEGC